MKAMGIDVGTTTVCGIVLDVDTGKASAVETLDNDTWIAGKPYEWIQDPEKIWERVQRIYRSFTEQFADIEVIGLTGQMHGIVYVDAGGQAVSPLYTWEDERGNLPMPGDADGQTYVERLSELSGYPMATGFGLATHYYNLQTGQVPPKAVSICTIHDYIGMKLTGRKRPLLTSSDAASLGCYDRERLCFDLEALERAGMDPAILPDCTRGFALLGETAEGIRVGGAIGDNQASVIGSVKDMENSLLVNIGTSCQASIGVRGYHAASGVELRPVVDDEYIFVGAGLCGGRAYAVLEQFFARVAELVTGEKPDKLYGMMAKFLETRGLEPGRLRVDTRFCGTREHPERTGGIYGLGVDNFTPEELTFGVLNGMAEEVVTFYRTMQEYGAGEPKYLIGSGNAIRNNPYLRRLFENIFGMQMQMPVHKEEAAYGAALFALTAAGVFRSLDEAQKRIVYE